MPINPTPLSNQEKISQTSPIFEQSLGVNAQMTRKVEYLVSKDKKKAQAILGISFVALILYSVFFFYGNASAYLKASDEIQTINQQVANFEQKVIPGLEGTKKAHKAAYDQEFQQVIQALDVVFPKDLDKLGIVQLLESFADEVSLTSPPFEFTSITLGKVIEGKNYQILPISTSIHSSQAGFDQFLALVEKSGGIYQDSNAEKKVLLDKMVRLMTISNVSIKYRGVDDKTGKDDGVDFSVKLNVYSRI